MSISEIKIPNIAENVIAVVVTYNRLELLKDLVNSLRNQTLKPKYILIVNNGSTDGTLNWLNSQSDLIIINQDNVGSSGGQFTSIKNALNYDCDWIWVMDDDIIHNINTLEHLLKFANKECVLTTLRYDNKNNVFLNDTISYNLTNPLKSFWKKIIDNKIIDNSNELIPAVGITFEGPLIHKNIIQKVGLPIFDFFIYGDDTEYFIRISKFNYPIYIVKSAITNRRLDYILNEKNENGKFVFNWKHYYIIRNSIIINKLHGSFLVRLFRPINYLIIWYFRADNSNSRKTVVKAFFDGIKYKLHKNNL